MKTTEWNKHKRAECKIIVNIKGAKGCREISYDGILDILSGDTPKGIKIQAKHLEALIELHNMTVLHTFARNVQHLMHSVVTN
uniref:Uncharacterized protein n=1 Tax=Populus trichocarpa TaxID=3694 RepID=A0A2K1X684_POPTR